MKTVDTDSDSKEDIESSQGPWSSATVFLKGWKSSSDERFRSRTMSQYKLTYFNGRGRAELARLLFAVAGVQYEDIRIEKDAWPQLKPTTPFGQLPVLEVDGITLAQSNAIARLLARRFNLAGKTELDVAHVDMVVDCLEDTLTPALGFFHEADEARKAELQKKYLESQLPGFLENLEKLLKQNHDGDGYFVGDELTWADLAFLSIVSILKMVGAVDPTSKYPKLDALHKRVEQHPKVAEWLAKRPQTNY